MLAPRASTARSPLACLVLVLVVFTTVRADEQQGNPWAFKDHDRIVFVGDTLIERDQRYGYLETMLTIANPDLDLTFRNLGWSGDTVRGLSRAGFDPPEAGFKRLIEQVTAAKPTVLVVGYGMADSFDGPAGLSRFVEGYNAFLDAVAPTKARLVLFSPLPHERPGPSLPNPSAHNRDLALYAEAVGKIADDRKASFIDLFKIFKKARHDRSQLASVEFPISDADTDDGIHLTALGSWRLAGSIGAGPSSKFYPSMGNPIDYTKKLEETDHSLKMVSAEARVRLPNSPGNANLRPTVTLGSMNWIQAKGLKPGLYELKIDGRPVLKKDALAWIQGVEAPFSPELEQVERLRQTIIEKNLLFFYRWRPQNITYLFGFRKHEQGRNAIEIPQFDPLVHAKEKEIARLRKPVAHTYELVRENEASQ